MKRNQSQCPKKRRKRTFQVPSIPSIGVDLVTTSSQEEILLVEGEQIHEQTYLLIETVQEGGPYRSEIQRGEEVQEMITFQPNSQDQ
jgi:hypothetical protein